MTRLVMQDVAVERASRAILSGITLTLNTGEMVALLGPNGAGKTTLIRAALGLERPTRGEVHLGNRDVGHLAPRERAALVAWLPQVRTAVNDVPAVELVAAARYRFRESHPRALQAARAALAQVDAEHLAERPADALSGGERQRVAIAALLAQEAPLLLLDEPANHLDPAQQLAAYQLIGKLWQRGAGILCVTHDVNLLASLPNPSRIRVLGLADGRLRFDLPYPSDELPPALSQLFGVSVRTVDTPSHRAIVTEPARTNGSTTPSTADTR